MYRESKNDESHKKKKKKKKKAISFLFVCTERKQHF
jgi:hypothetical protein